MKHIISALSTAALLLSALTGCGGTDRRASTAAENEEGAALTIRVVNESAVSLHSIAASYSADGKTLGSKVCERIEGNTVPAGYDFEFLPAELPTDPIGVFQIDVYAAEKAGEDYSACGSATIENPQAGTVYTLTLSGDSLSALTLSSAEKAVVISAPAKEDGNDD